MKNVDDRYLAVSVLLLLLALFIVRATAGNFEYRGFIPSRRFLRQSVKIAIWNSRPITLIQRLFYP